MSPSFAIIIPAYNEENTLRDLALRAVAVSNIVIIVNDGSSDRTNDTVADLPVTLITHDQNKGKAASIWDGITEARKYAVDYYITLDGDGQHAPEDVPKLLAMAAAKPDQIIIGARLSDKSAIPARRYYANRIANFWLAWAAGYPISDSQSGFRVYPARLFDNLRISTSKRNSFVFESEILIKAAQRGITSTSVAIPAVYAENARPSHFRGVRDITLITLMVAHSLFVRGFYPQGLYRSAIKPHLLPEHKGQTDYAGYLMATLSFVIMILGLGSTLIFSTVYVWTVARRTPASSQRLHVVILGKQLRNNLPDQDYQSRLDRGFELWQNQSQTQLYLLGGITGDSDISEARTGLHYLQNRGVDPASIHLEETSRNTLENLARTRSNTRIPSNDIALVTNRYHLARAGLMSRRFGYNVELCAAEILADRGIISKIHYIYEAVLIHWYLTGLLYSKLTRNKTLLMRIGS